jgi:UDP-4-amino-4,6-dideoxy-N-acetyl-beta-L-altrosamine N-acetyltransferase
MILIDNYMMRPLEKKDLPIILKWRNSERVHSMMLTDHKITESEHFEWYEKIVSKAKIPLHFIVELKGNPLGYIGYTDIDWEKKVCAPGAYIGDLDKTEIDSGIIIFYLSLVYAFEVLDFQLLSTTVLAKNKKAYKLDKFLGYSDKALLSEKIIRGDEKIDVYILEYRKDDWLRYKNKFGYIYKIV